LQVMLPSACSFIVEVSCHCFTLHVSAYGHLQVCRMLLLSCSWRNLLRWFFFLYFVRGYTFVRFHMYFPVLFFSFYLLFFALVFICLSFLTSTIQHNLQNPIDIWMSSSCQRPNVYVILFTADPTNTKFSLISTGLNLPSHHSKLDVPNSDRSH
jgi:hypothetical protein